MTLFFRILLFCVSLQSCVFSQPLNEIEIEKGHRLDNFNKGGTTSSLMLVYKNYSSNNELKNELSSSEIDLLKRVLEKAETKKHRQKKIAGIYAAIELCSKENCFCLLLTENIVFDISNKVEYHISKENQLSLERIFKK